MHSGEGKDWESIRCERSAYHYLDLLLPWHRSRPGQNPAIHMKL
jgi:hypothetical protein